MAIPIINVSILNGNNGFRIDGEGGGFYSGVSVSSAGDVNGDGFDDVMVGSRYSEPPGIYRGRSYVVLGKESGLDAVIDLANLDGNNGFRLSGGPSPYLVGDAGDVNGDGFDDVIIGGQGFYSSSTYTTIEGAGYVIFGKASGFVADINLPTLDGSNGFRLDVEGSRHVLVSGAGDVNGDGFDDVIVGVRTASYVVFGKASGFDATLDLASLDGSNGFRLKGGGTAVSNAGDINGDGFDDMIVGIDPDGYGLEGGQGTGYVVFGKASDFNPVVDLASLDGSNGFYFSDGRSNPPLTRGGDISVNGAGDINGDGFEDVMIGAPGYYNHLNHTSYEGASYVLFGRAAGFAAKIDLSSLDGSNGFRLDLAGGANVLVSSAGDVNGDGFDDVIVGIGARVGGTSYVVFGHAAGFDAVLDLSSIDGSNGFRLEGGAIPSSAGDVNNDGFDDLIIGNSDVGLYGASYVMFGGPFITGEPVYLGTAGDDQFTGTILAERFEAGDGNDTIDGFGGADIIESGSGDDTISVADLDFERVDGGTGSDTLELTGEGINLDLASLHDVIDGIETIDLQGSGDNSLALTLPSLLGLSDTTDTFTINGDVGDRVAGLIDGWTDGGVDGDYRIFTNDGTTLRIHLAVRTDVPVPGVISLADLDGNNGFRIDGAEESNSFGQSVSEAGDINGDGFDDVIIGAPFAHSLNGIPSGASYVIFGKASGFDDVIIGAPVADSNGDSSGASYVMFGKASGFDAVMDLSSLNGSNGFHLEGTAPEDGSGDSVSSAGDVNGDGFDDVIVGAPSADPNGSSSGSSYVVFGKALGFDARMELSNLNGNNGFRVDGDGGMQSGLSVSNAGDVNDDGYDDVMVGAWRADSNGYNTGSSYVVFGKSSGFSAALSLSNLDSNTGIRLDGIVGGDHSGESVSGAGDVNGDGFDDVMVGVPDADPNGESSGSSYVIFGRSDFGGGNVIKGTSGDDLLKGTSAAEIFEAGEGNDKMTGRGGADVFHGEAGNDYIQVLDIGFGLVDGGSGNDVLHTDGKDLNLDLTDYLDKIHNIHNIETICLHGRGDNTLALTGAELKQLSDTTNTLKVHGNAGDRIILEGNWIDGGSHGFYHMYTQDDAVLLVGMNMAAVFA